MFHLFKMTSNVIYSNCDLWQWIFIFYNNLREEIKKCKFSSSNKKKQRHVCENSCMQTRQRCENDGKTRNRKVDNKFKLFSAQKSLINWIKTYLLTFKSFFYLFILSSNFLSDLSINMYRVLYSSIRTIRLLKKNISARKNNLKRQCPHV